MLAPLVSIARRPWLVLALPDLVLHSRCSLKDNSLKAEGGMAIAAVLKDTQITHLKCALSLPPPYAHKC